jgi:gamma-glutamyltranspeptidase/glutathione hydrolase
MRAPRVHHQALPDQLVHEPGGLAPDAMAALQAMGYTLHQRDAIGTVDAVVRDGAGWCGMHDPRTAGSAAGL